MKTQNLFYQAVDQLQARIREADEKSIQEAAQLVVQAVKSRHSVYIYDTGHIIDSEIINRAGGFELLHPFKYTLDVKSEGVDKEQEDSSLIGLGKLALAKGNLIKDDVLFIGSVSGKSEGLVDLALAAQEKGIHVIAMTSVTYSSQVESMHPSKKHLYQCAEVVLDNQAPYGDAMLEVEGADSKFIPASGLAAAYIMWSVCAEVLDLLLAEGIQPGILRSVNAPGSRSYNKTLKDQYHSKGY